MEDYSRGRRGRFAKSLGRETGARVRIPYPPLFLFLRWPVGQAVKTPPFHGGNTGSNPVRVILLFYYHRGAEQLAARRAHSPEITGSNPVSAIVSVP